MKVMSRNFTRAEKIILLVLILFLVGLVYYRLIDVPVREAMASYQADLNDIELQLGSREAELKRLQGIQHSLDDLESNGQMSYMGSYNNSKEEIAFLNDILGKAESYSISFDRVSRSGDQIRRNFTLQYTTKDYETAKKILKKLSNGKLRVIVGDLRCSVAADGRTSMSQSATFFETMVGGVADAGLPADSGNVNQ